MAYIALTPGMSDGYSRRFYYPKIHLPFPKILQKVLILFNFKVILFTKAMLDLYQGCANDIFKIFYLGLIYP